MIINECHCGVKCFTKFRGGAEEIRNMWLVNEGGAALRQLPGVRKLIDSEVHFMPGKAFPYWGRLSCQSVYDLSLQKTCHGSIRVFTQSLIIVIYYFCLQHYWFPVEERKMTDARGQFTPAELISINDSNAENNNLLGEARDNAFGKRSDSLGPAENRSHSVSGIILSRNNHSAEDNSGHGNFLDSDNLEYGSFIWQSLNQLSCQAYSRAPLTGAAFTGAELGLGLSATIVGAIETTFSPVIAGLRYPIHGEDFYGGLKTQANMGVKTALTGAFSMAHFSMV